jgi:hypothetical protein
MPQTPDRHPGRFYEDESITLGTSSLDPPIEDGSFRYVSGSGIRFREEGKLRTTQPYGNPTGSIAPTIFDDITKGYDLGSTWIISSSQQAYILVDPTSGSAVWKETTVTASGISETDHKSLRHLIHFINEGPGDGFYSNPFREISGGIFPTRVTWWSDSNKTFRLFQTEITRSGIYPITESHKMFAADGLTILASAKDVITYSGAFELARSRSYA